MTAANPARAAVLVDLENILHVGNSRRWPWLQGAAASNLLNRCLRTARVMLHREPDRVLAVSCPDLMRRVAFLPPLHNLPCRIASAAPDAADQQLLDDAAHLAEIGFTRFVIVSGDHIFTDFARAHETYVIARPGTLSHRLRRAAVRADLIDSRITSRQRMEHRRTA